MKLGELRKIIADIDTVYDNCDVTCYESNGNLLQLLLILGRRM